MNQGVPEQGRPNLFSRMFTSAKLYRDFRLLWMGSLSEHLGEWMETIALLWLVNQMTHSPFMGTLVATLRYLPMVVFGFIGGIVADRFNRRYVLMCALAGAAVASLALAVVVHLNLIQVWHLLVYAGLSGIANSFNHPSRSTLLPNLVDRKHLLNAITLDNASVMASRIVATPLAGFIIDFAGTTPVLGLRAAGSIMAIIWLSWIRTKPPSRVARKQSPFRNFVEGMRYVVQHKAVLTQVLLYILPIFVTNTYTGLLPYYATNYLNIGPDLYGILNAAPGAGAFIAAMVLASFVTLKNKGSYMFIVGMVQGACMFFFFFSHSYILPLFILVLVGAANTSFMTLNNTIIQEMTADDMRGRVMSLRDVSYGLGPAGSLISGAIAGALGVPAALAIAGGISIAALAAIYLALPQTRRQLGKKEGAT